MVVLGIVMGFWWDYAKLRLEVSRLHSWDTHDAATGWGN